jgi:hypothetical protein
MAKSSIRHPKITALRAFDLVLALEYQRGREQNGTSGAEDAARNALISHVRASLVRGRR